MIALSNGYKFDVACASGAFAFLNGWYWEQPLRWCGLLRPQEWTITIKTLTLGPVKGNLRLWWPFNLYRNCVQTYDTGTVNAVGLTNMGLPQWIAKYYPQVEKLGLNVILSVLAKTTEEARRMGKLLRPLKAIKGVEINGSCPNVDHDRTVEHCVSVVKALRSECDHPLGYKVSYDDPYIDILRSVEEYLEFAVLINTVKWSTVYPNKPSPLAPWGLEGGVSGDDLIPYAREALVKYGNSGIKVPAVSCGGIATPDEVYARFVMGARAVQIGTKIKDDPIGAQKLFDQVTQTIRRSNA